MSWGEIPRSVRTALRLAVFARDDYLCQLRYPGICTTVATQADHVRDRAIYGDNLDNLQGACRPCNLHKGKPSGVNPPAPRVEGAWW
jgi:5-methylcytosine-specific restriction endonuclease McrA